MTRSKTRKDDAAAVPVISNEEDGNGELHDDAIAPEVEINDDSRSITPGAIEAAPPPGAQVTHTHQTRWAAPAPQTTQNGRGFTPQQYSDGPADPLREFLDQFNDGEFYTMQVTRDPDPLLKRPPNPTYLRPCFVREILGNGIPLMSQSFIDDLRVLNGGSGGNFSVSVYDDAEQFVDAWHGNIGDPVTAYNHAAPVSAAAAQQVDQMTAFMNTMRQQAEFVKLSRVVAGVPEGGMPQAVAPADPELQLAALLIKHGDVVGKITGAVSETVANVVKNSGGGDNNKPTTFFESIKQAIATNPKLQTRLAQTVDKIVDVGAKVAGVDTTPPIPPNAAPETELQTDDGDGDGDANAIDAEDDEDENAEAVLLDFLVNECAEGRNVTFQHPVFAAYGQHEPENYNTLLIGLKMMNPDTLIETILTRAAEFDRAGAYRLVLKRPEGVAWVQHLQTSAINSQPLTTTETN
jgi:hypothetical protein